MPQISASVKENTIEIIKYMAAEDNRSFSEKVAMILTEAAAKWVTNRPKTKSKKP